MRIWMGIISCVLLSLAVQAQVTLVTVTDTVFKHPESAVYDAQRGVIYVSNMNKATPRDSLHTDFITSMNVDGTINEVEWVSGLSSPTGLAIYQDRLYAVEANGVAVIDIDQQSVIRRIPINDAGFLNDIAFNKYGTMYVSETEPAGRIFRIRGDYVETWMEDTTLANTNGLLAVGDVLYLGVNGNNSLKYIILSTNEILTLAELGPGNIDGIQLIEGGVLVSHFLGNLYFVSHALEVKELLNTRGQDIFMADFCFIPSLNKIIIPSLRTDRVHIYQYDNKH